MSKYEKIGKYKIFFDETYYLAYVGGHRELSSKDMKEYYNIKRLPLLLQQSEIRKLGQEKNPNVIPLKGIEILSFIKDLKFMPFFDAYFERSHVMQLNDVMTYEHIKQYTQRKTLTQ